MSGGPPDPKSEEALRRFAQTIQMLQGIANANAKAAEAVNNLASILVHPKDGMIATLDDVLLELQGIRRDLAVHRKEMAATRAAIAAIPGISIFGGGRR